jgi:alkylation response protein AidB-like acyl-CoA dehydrogenase
MSQRSKQPYGSAFLISEVGDERIFTSDDFTDEQRMFAETAQRFMDEAVLPRIEALEHPDAGFSAMVGLLKQAGELGLLMIDVPEAYGGLGLDKTTSMLCGEKLAIHGSFAVSWGAHVGIGSLPLVYFGDEAQKKKWLPKLATGELLAAYALTEPGSGSDALAARTTATLTPDGTHYVLNGTKMWITNAGIADLFTVFCQVDGSKFTAFLVEATREGLSTGAEERKMGLKGSSTRMLILDNVRVPVENVLGEVGRGHKIAFNILNFGRFKLGVGVLGGCKQALAQGAAYATERKQFGEAIANFGAIREKLAQVAAVCYALDSMCYRVAGYMDQTIDPLDEAAPSYAQQVMDAIEEFVVEDSIMKVYGSEALGLATDELVQIFGGYGYSAEYPAERAYRDARIQRIFEGTNEINRLLIPGQILKNTMKGRLPLFQAIQRAEASMSGEEEALPADDPATLSRERFLTEKAKQLSVFVMNKALQKHMADLKDQQEVLLRLADMVIACYAMDSTVTRTLQTPASSPLVGLRRAAAGLIVARHYPEVLQLAQELCNHLAGGDEGLLASYEAAQARFTWRHGINVVSRQRALAGAVIDKLRYPL